MGIGMQILDAGAVGFKAPPSPEGCGVALVAHATHGFPQLTGKRVKGHVLYDTTKG